MFHRFADRVEAGRVLASALSSYAGRSDVLVLALPRGGVPVAREVAQALGVPMDLWIVRKLGVPGAEELAMGALAGNGVCVFNDDVIAYMQIDKGTIGAVRMREQAELERRNDLYRHGLPPLDVAGKAVIVVDDGFATGATMRAAIASLRKAGASWIVAAAPVGAASTCRIIEREADDMVCVYTPEPFAGVGMWYADFSQTTDQQVQAIMQTQATAAAQAAHP
ncbi:MAG: phosphoribosyltransferase [Micavibrio aeruginosavorus]|nr:phosphoribosyltransferase [Micavibrio aeruginosavorus]